MPIHMGIMCEECGRVYFIATSDRIYPSRTAKTIYHLACVLPCLERRDFRIDDMRPYRVDENVFKRGFALEGEYERIQTPEPEKPPDKLAS